MTTTPTNVSTELRSLNQSSPLIELFTLDCTSIGGSVYHFTPNVDVTSSPVVYQGITYQPLPVQTSGWELSATDTQPRPTLTVSNVTSVFMSAVQSLGDIVNARVERLRTLYKFLDGQPTADPNAYINPVDVYWVYQKTTQNKHVISWQLATPAEAFSMQLPARQYLKDFGFPGLSRIRI
jgi:lambda family phage minor tail protein L